MSYIILYSLFVKLEACSLRLEACGPVELNLFLTMHSLQVLTSCRATYHSQLLLLLIDTPVITFKCFVHTDPRSIGLKPSGNCLPVHQGLTAYRLLTDPRSYGIRRATSIEASQDPGSLLHRTRDQYRSITRRRHYAV